MATTTINGRLRIAVVSAAATAMLSVGAWTPAVADHVDRDADACFDGNTPGSTDTEFNMGGLQVAGFGFNSGFQSGPDDSKPYQDFYLDVCGQIFTPVILGQGIHVDVFQSGRVINDQASTCPAGPQVVVDWDVKAPVIGAYNLPYVSCGH